MVVSQPVITASAGPMVVTTAWVMLFSVVMNAVPKSRTCASERSDTLCTLGMAWSTLLKSIFAKVSAEVQSISMNDFEMAGMFLPMFAVCIAPSLSSE